MTISIVLEHTSHPGNIGAVARAMHTMGFEDLVLINPCEITEEAHLRARGGASIIENAKIYQNVEPLGDYHFIYGTTSRHRSLYLPVHTSREVATMVNSEASEHKVAILFGNEQHGLSNQLLNLCQAVIEIPATVGHSLNLSHAVQIICYELSAETGVLTTKPTATLKERQDFIQWLETYYQGSKFLLPHTLERIQSILSKAKLTSAEVKLLYSLISSKPKDSIEQDPLEE